MYNNDYFMYILDMCSNLDIDELKCLIANIETMIKNKESEENDK